MLGEVLELLELRWAERDRELTRQFLKVTQEMGKRNITASSIAIQRYHEVLVSEFELQRGIISKSIIDAHRSQGKVVSSKESESFAQETLEQRKSRLEQALESITRRIIDGLNQTMVAPYRNLDTVYPLAVAELSVELSQAIKDYTNELGGSLWGIIVNRFKNYPIIVVGGITITVALVIGSLLNLLGVI